MDNLDLSTPGCILLLGKPKRGKTSALKHIILKHSLDNFYGSAKFEFGIVFCRSKFTGEYDFIGDQDYIYETYDDEVLSDYVEKLKELIEKGKPVPNNFIVFDDQIGLLNKMSPVFTNFLGTHRKTNTTIFFATQHLKTGASTTLREITTHAVLFNSKQMNTLQALYENFGQLFENFG
jgi:hypothetical protein